MKTYEMVGSFGLGIFQEREIPRLLAQGCKFRHADEKAEYEGKSKAEEKPVEAKKKAPKKK
jgi:hypothetical protein